MTYGAYAGPQEEELRRTEVLRVDAFVGQLAQESELIEREVIQPAAPAALARATMAPVSRVLVVTRT